MNARMLRFAAVLLALFPGPALSHHSFSMFDRTRTVAIEGTIKSLDWVNPHAWLQVLVTDAEDQTDVWSLEMGGPNQLTRQGWRPDTVKTGDRITVRMHPLRDGSYGGQFVSIVLPDGRTMGER